MRFELAEERYHLFVFLVCGLALGLVLVPGGAAPISRELRDFPGKAAGDPLPPGASARLGSPRLRHTWLINALSFSADGKFLASGGEAYSGGGYGAVRIWEVPSGREVRSIWREYGAVVQRVVLSPDGKLVAWSEGKANGIAVADVATGRLLGRLHAVGDKDRKGTLPALAFAPDGKMLATASRDSTLRLWDLTTGGEVFQTKVGPIDRCRFSPDGKVLAILGDGFAGLRLLDVSDRASTGKPKPFPPVRPAPYAIAFSPDGQLLAGGDNGLVRLWEVPTGKEVRRLTWPGQEAHAVGFSADGKTLAAASADGHFHTWAVATGKPQRRFDLPFKRTTSAIPPRVALSPDLRWLASVPGAKIIRLGDLTAGREVPPPTESPGSSYTFAYTFSPDSKLMVTPNHEGRLGFWNARSGVLLRQSDRKAGDIYWARFDPTGKQVITLSYKKPPTTLYLAEWDAATGKRQREINLGFSPGVVALSPDGKLLACGEPNDQRYRSDPTSTAETVLLDRATGKPVRRFDAGQVYSSRALTFSGDSHTLASVSPKGTIRLWDVATSKVIQRMESGGQEGLYHALRFLPDGKTLLSLSMTYGKFGHRLSRLVEWDLATGKVIQESEGPRDLEWCLGLSPDGKLLAWARQHPDVVEVWDIAAGKPRHQFRGEGGGWRFLTFAPDSRALATGCGDDTILIWDTSDRKNQ
jgi:WD40 repeat protein